jgi:hypothetical protein
MKHMLTGATAAALSAVGPAMLFAHPAAGHADVATWQMRTVAATATQSVLACRTPRRT